MDIVKVDELKFLVQDIPLLNYDDDHQEDIDLVVSTAMEHNLYALSAPQIGIKKRFFVLGDPEIRKTYTEFSNPEIIYSEDFKVKKENFVNWPRDFIIRNKRPELIRLRVDLPIGEKQIIKYTGITARLVDQHVDLLNGIFFTQIASTYHYEQALRQYNRARKRAGELNL